MKIFKITVRFGFYRETMNISDAISFKIREFYEYDFNPSVEIASDFFVYQAGSLRIASPKIETITRI